MSYPTAQGNYQVMPQPGNPRYTEAWALTEAARRIASSKDKPGATEEFLAAIRLNWRLWTIFQAEISSDTCPLPPEMRANMLSLSNFVDKTSVEIIADPQPEKADILVTINRHLAAGLFTPVPDGDEVKTDQQPVGGGLSNLSI